jgi:phosphoglycolate phosphatase-like HAD superfamily hydrolase
MQRKLVLFDIDGTILLSGGAGRRALVRVITTAGADPDVFGKIRFDGKTDPQIIVELLREAGHEWSGQQEMIETLSDQYLDLLESELAAKDAPPPTLMPGVTTLLDALHQDERATLGLVTGNLARGAALKLRSVGLDPERFVIGAFGSDSPHRPDLPAIAADRAKPLFGHAPSGHDVVIIGDTPADVTCGQAIGARAIGVATGSYSADDLRDAGAYLVVDDLIETRRILDVIFG